MQTLTLKKTFKVIDKDEQVALPEILFLTTYPPRECGIATYSQDLVDALINKFNQSFSVRICALESGIEKHEYTSPEVLYTLNADDAENFGHLANEVNNNPLIRLVVIQHEFGLFKRNEK